MCIKRKILSVIIMVFCSTAGLANPLDGSQANYNNTSPSVSHDFFVQADIAYASSDWASLNSKPLLLGVDSENQNGFAYGAELGVSLIPHVFFELDAIHLPSVDYTRSSGGRITSWVFNVAGKILVPVPVITSMQFFAKAGYGMRLVNDSKTGVGQRNYWTPIFGVGAQYSILGGLYLGAEYVRVAQNDGDDNHKVPAANLYVGFLNLQLGS